MERHIKRHAPQKSTNKKNQNHMQNRNMDSLFYYVYALPPFICVVVSPSALKWKYMHVLFECCVVC